MSVNLMSIEQANTLLTAIYEQATGQAVVAPVDASNFVSVAQTTLRTGYDTVMAAISQVLTRTIFSIRPYTGKYAGVEVDNERWGAITRKINFIDTPIEADQRLTITDGQSIDPWKVQKPKAIQTMFYGANQYQKHITIFRDQLDVAFSSQAEFNRFISGVMQNVMDQLEMIREGEARLALLNMIAARHAMQTPGTLVNVLSDYNAQAVTQVTDFEDLFAQGTIDSFTKYLYSRIKTDSDMLENRSILYHANVTGKEVMRHTPKAYQKLYMPSRMFHNIDANVLSVTFNDDYLKLDRKETVPYWQELRTPYEVNYKGVIMNTTTGDYADMQAAENFNCVGILYDRDALGIVRKSTWMEASPFNPAGGYYNLFWHVTFQSWNDLTENAIVYYAPKE